MFTNISENFCLLSQWANQNDRWLSKVFDKELEELPAGKDLCGKPPKVIEKKAFKGY